MVLGFLVATIAANAGGVYLLLFWLAANFVSLGIAYSSGNPAVFGKQADGSRNLFGKLFLLPYSVLIFVTWHFSRIFGKENSYDVLDSQLAIGRRLLTSEFPTGIDNVIDLTCEFSEPSEIVKGSNYVSFPILDASVPIEDQLKQIVGQIDALSGNTYIHCAQGHGRTGLVSAALLLHRNPELTVDDAIARLRAVRPKLACNREQIAALRRLSS